MRTQYYNSTKNRDARQLRAEQLELLLDEQGQTDGGRNAGKYGIPLEYSQSTYTLYLMDSGRQGDETSAGTFDVPVLTFADRRRLPTTMWSIMPNDDHTGI